MDKEFKQIELESQEKTLNDYIQIKDGRLVLQAPLETNNFLPGTRGVQIRQEGLNSSGGTINGAVIGGTTGLSVTNGGTGATSLTGIVKGNGTSAMTAIVPLAGTKIYWVSDTSGGAVNRKLTFQDGILVSEV